MTANPSPHPAARRDGFFGEAELGPVARAGNVPFVLAIFIYQITLSPFIGRHCRFEPTCSRYGMTAYRRYGPLRGSWLTAARIARCHPFRAGGYDPVPARPTPPKDVHSSPNASAPTRADHHSGDRSGRSDHGPAAGGEAT